jgi:hypothetical protein
MTEKLRRNVNERRTRVTTSNLSRFPFVKRESLSHQPMFVPNCCRRFYGIEMISLLRNENFLPTEDEISRQLGYLPNNITEYYMRDFGEPRQVGLFGRLCVRTG